LKVLLLVDWLRPAMILKIIPLLKGLSMIIWVFGGKIELSINNKGLLRERNLQ
jgi:hypothetical protein